ncbi:MAG: stalk domain-containing protein, partial [Proteocatella sp.]
MKKKLALFMTMMLTMSMIPFSSFAEKTDDFVKVVNGIEEYGARDENKPVSFTIDLGENAYLSRGMVELTLKNVKTARVANPITAKFMEGDKEVGTETEVTFEDKIKSEPLRGNEENFYMRIGGSKDLENKGKENTKLLITMRLDFSNSTLGDVDVRMKDLSQEGIGDKEFTIAKFSGTMQRSMLIDVADSKIRVGKAGGALSSFEVTRFDTLDSQTASNTVEIKLPANIEFNTKNTEVMLDGKKITPTYKDGNRILMLSNVSRNADKLVVKPYIDIDDEKIPYGDVKLNINFYIGSRSVDGKEVSIGMVTDSGAQVKITEKGKDRIPKLTAGETKTVEVTLDGVKGTFSKGSLINFKLDGIDAVYGKVTIIDPKGKIMPMGQSAGKSAGDTVNNLEVYKNRTFDFKVLENDMNQIKFEMDITAGMMEGGKAQLSLIKDGVEQSRTDLANVESKAKVETTISTVAKGSVFKGQDIILRETRAGSFEVGDVLYFVFDRANMGFDISDLKVTSTQNVEFSEPKVNKDGVLELKVNRKSYNAPARIDITGIKVYTTENVVGGVAKLKINLNKIDDNTIYEVDYVNILGGGISNITVFTIGSKNYTTSGTQKEASEAPYVKNGYTMLPVRALAESLGLTSTWDNESKIATFANKSKIAVVELGKNTMIVNGTAVPLSVPAELKNGATMIELRGLANAFGVDIDWNGAQKTATV